MRTTWGRTGQATTLTCGVDLPQETNFALEWRKNDKLIFSAYGKESGHAAPSLQGRVARGSGLSLTIHSVSLEDAGVYSCVVTKFAKQPTRPQTGSSIKLVVNVPPKIVSPEMGLVEYVKDGDKFHIECKVEGTPPPEISWTKNGRIVSASPVLHLANVTSNDQGQYSCVAANIEGTRETNIELRFSKKISFHFVPGNKTVIEGSNVYWHCHASSQPNLISYTWTFKDRPIKKTPTGLRAEIQNGDLSIKEVRKDDRGWYRCDATNERGEMEQASAYLDVQYVPELSKSHKQVTTIGTRTNGSVNCGVEANPPATLFSWTKNGHFLGTFSKESYDIVEAKESDGGIYKCLARNELGDGEAVETHVIVADPPTFATKPPSEVRIREGMPLEINCDGFGDPQPIVYWIHNQTRISTSSLAFSAVTHEDHGKYECVVSNSVASISSVLHLVVERSRPQPSNITNVDCFGENGLEIKWQPGFDGSHSQTFVVHYRSDADSSRKTVTTTTTSALLPNLTPFAVYDIHVESRNMKGSSRSNSVRQAVCSTLASPSEVFLNGNTLEWSPVPHARSYRVESRSSSKQAFKEMSEVFHTHFRFPPDALKPMQVRVRSLRSPFQPSAPSENVNIGRTETDIPASYAILGGVFSLIFLLLVVFLWKRRSSKKLKKKNSFKEYGVKSCTTGNTQLHSETYYEPSLNLYSGMSDSSDSEGCLRVDDGEYSEWTGIPEESERIRYPQDMLGLEYETGDDQSAVGDMLRNKYIYGVEDVPAQLITDLRIERLRREFKQSQL